MSNDFFKVILNKTLKGNPSKLECHNKFDRFVWEVGCIKGWEREVIEADKSPISYSCTTDFFENDKVYLNMWIEELKSHHSFTIVNNTELSGEVLINFEAN